MPLVDLERWSAGNAKPPLAVFLKAIDLVLDETSPRDGAARDPSRIL